MSISLVMRAVLAATVLAAAPALAKAQAPQAKHPRSAVHKSSKAPVHRAHVVKKSKKRAGPSRLPVPEHPNGKARW